MSRQDETRQAKLEKRQELEKRGVNVHPPFFDKKMTILESRDLPLKTIVQTAGRIMAIRSHGKVVFIDIQDTSANIQVMIRQENIGDDQFALLSFIDRGDFIGVHGELATSKTGELSIIADTVSILGKALLPLPTEWNAAEDKEARFRKRYVDMLISSQSKSVLDARWTILKETRRYLQDVHNFVEVETPILQPVYGGTNAKPFSTYMNALDSTFFLRIAPELYLKRLIVGGYDKVFEIARNFRNEGLDQTHQPEFTMIEWYEAYADYSKIMSVTEGLFQHLVNKLYGGSTLKVGELEINVSGSWPKVTMKEALNKYVDIDFDSLSDNEINEHLSNHQIKLTGAFARGKALFALFDNLVTPLLIGPIWIIDYPRDISPLSKQHRFNPDLAERFEGYIGGKEICDGWSEITDPLDQRHIFEHEQVNMREGNDEAHPLDEDFLEAMEYGMPPLGGIGLGIDRLVMFLTNTWSIKEVIAFPTLRPLQYQKQIQDSYLAAHAIKPTRVKKSAATSTKLPDRDRSIELLEKFVKSPALLHHCHMVATAMEAYAKMLGEDTELWHQTGLLHDLDWEMYPDEHPNKAIAELLGDYPQELKDAIAAHAPDRTGKQPETLLERYIFACDELSGLMHAVSLMRPGGFEGMEPKSIKKKLKDKSFAANVSRDDINHGFELIGKTADEHIGFLIEVFSAS